MRIAIIGAGGRAAISAACSPRRAPRLGRTLHIPTPHNDAIYAALEPYRVGGREA